MTSKAIGVGVTTEMYRPETGGVNVKEVYVGTPAQLKDHFEDVHGLTDDGIRRWTPSFDEQISAATEAGMPLAVLVHDDEDMGEWFVNGKLVMIMEERENA